MGKNRSWDKLPAEWRDKFSNWAKNKLEKKIRDEIAKRNNSNPTDVIDKKEPPLKNPNWTEKFPKR